MNTQQEIPDHHHFRREDRTLRWKRIAAHLSEYPADFNIALENLDRWERGRRLHTGPIIEWRKRILAAQASPSAMADLLRFLETPNHDSEPIKSCSPFVGVVKEIPWE